MKVVPMPLGASQVVACGFASVLTLASRRTLSGVLVYSIAQSVLKHGILYVQGY
jgi:hypothetical protein